MDALRERNIKVPEQISLASYDSVDLCTFLTPHATAMHFPITDMARQAGKLLMYHLKVKGFNKPETLTFNGELKVRSSIKELI